MTIPELYSNELVYWTLANQKFLGLTPIDETWDFAKIQASVDNDCAKFWNTAKPCKLAKNLNNGTLNKEAAKQTKNSYILKVNFLSMCVDIYGDYSGKLLKVGAMPLPCIDLSWIIKKSHYIPRAMAIKDLYGMVQRTDFNTVQGKNWIYNISEDEFVFNSKSEDGISTEEEAFDLLEERSICLLTSLLKEPLTRENFRQALKLVPTFSNCSIFNYKFIRMEIFEDIVFNSVKYAQPTKEILFPCNTLILGVNKQYSQYGYKIEGSLVRSESKIFALENFRTVINVFSNKKTGSDFQPKFTYTDANGFFDSFKTVTSKSAGRQRLLLDNVVMKHGMLYIIDEDGTQHNMFDYIGQPQDARLSCLSEALFCDNDKPKRIMMNAKMTSQAVPLEGEIDDLTHRIMVRVGFMDMEGYTTADSIVISESMAKRLETKSSEILYLDKGSNLYKLITNAKTFDLLTLKQIFPKKNDAILLSYTNMHIEKIDNISETRARIFLSWNIPFRLGDKITNMHGAKGTVGVILPDDKMPRLTKKVGNMKAGPLEIIFSGFSTMRRGSLGQIFEAWALATGHTDVKFIAEALDKYGKEMKTFSKNSIVEYNGESTVIPVGYNYVMRLYHHASTKVSCSSAEFAYKRTLRFGEMEKLNLMANGCPNILKELGIRSITKYIGAHKHIDYMQETRHLPKRTHMSMQFVEILKSIGYELVTTKLSSNYSEIGEKDAVYLNSVLKKENDNETND